MDHRTNRNYFPVQRQLFGYYDRDIVLTARYELNLYLIPINRSLCWKVAFWVMVILWHK